MTTEHTQGREPTEHEGTLIALMIQAIQMTASLNQMTNGVVCTACATVIGIIGANNADEDLDAALDAMVAQVRLARQSTIEGRAKAEAARKVIAQAIAMGEAVGRG